MTSGFPDLGSILKPIVYGPHAPMVDGLTRMLDEALGLFGQGSSRDSTVGSSDVEAMKDAINYGMAADAERGASKDLADSKQALEAIDSELDRLAKQFVDDNDASKKRLVALKGEVDNELNYLNTNTADDSVTKVAAVQKFLSDKAGEASEVILSAAQQISKRQQQIDDVASQYPNGGAAVGGVGGGSGAVDGGVESGSFIPGDAGWDTGGGSADFGDDGGGFYDDGVGSLADLAGMLPQMASGLPGALGGLGGAGMGNPLGDLGGLIGSAVRDANAGHDKADREQESKNEDAKAAEEKKDEDGATGAAPPQDGQEHKDGGGEPAAQEVKAEAGGPAPPPPTPAPTMVTRPDGTTATASSAAAAAAARAHLGGQDLMAAYKDANITVPQPGTPIKDTIAPAKLQMGDLAAFQDRYVMCEGDGKVYLDGQTQPLSALAKMRGFLAFFRPTAPADVPATATSAAAGAPVTAAAATTAMP